MSSGGHSPYGGALASGSAPHTFASGAAAAQVDSSIVVEWDFDNDGDFDETVEDITAYVLSAETTTGRDFPSNLTGNTGPGKLRLSLVNDDDRFSYFNTTSPLATSPFSLRTGRKIRVRTSEQTLGASDITYVGIGAIAAGSNTSLVPALPTGLQSAATATDGNADLMLIAAAIRNSGTGTVDTPTGWAPLLTSGNLTILGKYYADGDTAPTVTFTGGVANATTLAQCFAFRGCHQTLSEVLATSIAQLNGSAQNMAVPGLVAAAIPGRLADPDDVTMVVVGWKQDDWTSVAALSGQLFTEISDSPSALGDDAGIQIQYRIGGFSGAKTFTGTNLTVTGGASAISRTMVLALTPAGDRTDPELLVRDRFARASNPALGAAETGETWTVRANGGFGLDSHTAAVPALRDASNTGVDIISTIDTGVTDHYVQATIPMQVQDGRVGLIVRYSDNNNYTRAYYSNTDRALIVEDVSTGTPTILTTFLIEAYDGMTLGVGVVNQTVTLYLGGTELSIDTLPGTITGTHAGLYGKWEVHSDVPPRVDEFYAWDRVRSSVDGILWTGYVKDVSTSVSAGALKVVTVNAEGPLAAAAVAEVPAPRIVRSVGESDVSGNHSVPAGSMVGDIMARAGLLHPPHPIDGSLISHFGPVALDDGKALELARHVEGTERGMIIETSEGAVAFQDRTYRAALSSSAWFSDTPSTGQFPYSKIVPLDHQAQIINRATAQVAATCPTVVAVENQAYGLVSMDIDVVLPDVQPGDLLIVFIVSSGDPTFDWLIPHTWDMHNQQGTFQGLRCYTHVCDGTESGETVQFYTSTELGAAIAHIYTVRDWYGTNDGLKLSRGSFGTVEGGEDAYPLQAWNRAPALYIVVQDVIGADPGGILWGPLDAPPPVGYDYLSLEGLVTVSGGGFEGYDVGIESVYKTDILGTENPRKWAGVFDDWLVLRETHVFAVRGYNGPLGKNTLDDADAIGGDGWFVTLNDLDSQLDHNVVRSNPNPPKLFYTEADARDFCADVLTEFADDRPIIQLMFYPSKSAALRTQARNRRVSDKVTVTASGNAGLGINGDFHIESVSHKWTNGTRLWVTTWELSPV